MFKPQKTVAIENSAGEICAGLDCPCPPGVPLVMPGELIDNTVVDALKIYGVKTVPVIAKASV